MHDSDVPDLTKGRARRPLLWIGGVLVVVAIAAVAWRVQRWHDKGEARRAVARGWARYERCLIGPPLAAGETVQTRVRRIWLATPPAKDGEDRAALWPDRCARYLVDLPSAAREGGYPEALADALVQAGTDATYSRGGDPTHSFDHFNDTFAAVAKAGIALGQPAADVPPPAAAVRPFDADTLAPIGDGYTIDHARREGGREGGGAWRFVVDGKRMCTIDARGGSCQAMTAPDPGAPGPAAAPPGHGKLRSAPLLVGDTLFWTEGPPGKPGKLWMKPQAGAPQELGGLPPPSEVWEGDELSGCAAGGVTAVAIAVGSGRAWFAMRDAKGWSKPAPSEFAFLSQPDCRAAGVTVVLGDLTRIRCTSAGCGKDQVVLQLPDDPVSADIGGQGVVAHGKFFYAAAPGAAGGVRLRVGPVEKLHDVPDRLLLDDQHEEWHHGLDPAHMTLIGGDDEGLLLVTAADARLYAFRVSPAGEVTPVGRAP